MSLQKHLQEFFIAMPLTSGFRSLNVRLQVRELMQEMKLRLTLIPV